MVNYFSYDEEPRNDTLCIDMKSFYASVECVARDLDPLKEILVVMSNADNAGGLILAASPMAKKVLGISNVARKFDLPDHPDLKIVPPRMNLYIQKNMEINQIFRQFVPDEDILIYSSDESFVMIEQSKKLFHKTAYEFAQLFQRLIYEKTKLYCTVGIGDNPLLAKIALDIEAKHTPDMIAHWHYEDVPQKIWKINDVTEFWGINTRTAKKLNAMGIRNMYDLAHADYYQIKSKLGVIGTQLLAHAWGIDRTSFKEKYLPKSKSIGNSQILPRDYKVQREIEIVIREMAEQIASRVRKQDMQTGCISIGIGYSMFEEASGFSRQLAIEQTANSKKIVAYFLSLFRKFYTGETVRSISVSCSKLLVNHSLQLDLFSEPEQEINNNQLDFLVDAIREKYGFQAIVHASSLSDGARAIERSKLVGGHAGGMEDNNNEIK